MGFCKSGLRIGVAWVPSGVEWNCVLWGAVDLIAVGWSAAEWGSGVSGVEWSEVERDGAICVEMELAWSGLHCNGAEWSAGTWTGAYMGHV